MKITFTAPLWLWNGKGAWHFVTLPLNESQIIKMAVPRRGWGSVRVKAKIGGTDWSTSIFPDSKAGAYLLPVKAEVRKRENIAPGDMVEISVSLDL
jgi:hypothetical protein